MQLLNPILYFPHSSSYIISSLLLLLFSCVWLFVTPWSVALQASLSITNSQSLLKLMSSEWCHPTISSSVIPFSSCRQSFPASGSFQMSQLFASGGQSIGVSASASVIPMNIQDWFHLGWTGWISLQSKGLKESSPAPQFEGINSLALSLFYCQLSYLYMTTRKTIALTRWTFVGKAMSLLFNTLSRFVIAVLPRNQHLLISWLQSLFVVILKPKKIESVTVSTVYPSVCYEVMGPDTLIFVFWI